jgi:hypothetical protein
MIPGRREPHGHDDLLVHEPTDLCARNRPAIGRAVANLEGSASDLRQLQRELQRYTGSAAPPSASRIFSGFGGCGRRRKAIQG